MSHFSTISAIIYLLIAMNLLHLVVSQEEELNGFTNLKMPELVSLGPSKVSSNGKHVEINVP